MLSRSSLLLMFGALSLPGLGGCKSVYSDTFSYRKNGFQAPVAKQTEIVPPPSMPLDGMPPAEQMPGGLEGIPGAPAADPGAMPGAAPGAVPGLPEAAPAPGAAPAPAPAVPGLN